MMLREDNFTTINNLCETNTTDYNQMMSTIHVIICVCSFPLNGYVVWLIVRGAERVIESDFFMLNLALTDILFFSGCLLMPFVNFCPNPLEATLSFFYGFLITGHPLFQTCICVERYLAVIHPVLFLKYKHLRFKLTCSSLIWLMTLMTSLAFVFLDYGFVEIFWSTSTLILLVVMSCCCLAVLRGLMKPGPGEGEKGRMGANQIKMKAFRIIVVMVFIQLTIAIVHVVCLCFSRLLYLHELKEVTLGIMFIIIMIIYLIQPLIYLHRAGKLPCIPNP